MSVYKLTSSYDGAGVEDLVYSQERTLRTVPFYDLLCEVMLQTSDTPDSLVLNVTESIHLNAILQTRFSKSAKSHSSRSCDDSEKVEEENFRVDEDGTVHMVVEPVIGDENVRRSKQVRTVRIMTDS